MKFQLTYQAKKLTSAEKLKLPAEVDAANPVGAIIEAAGMILPKTRTKVFGISAQQIKKN